MLHMCAHIHKRTMYILYTYAYTHYSPEGEADMSRYNTLDGSHSSAPDVADTIINGTMIEIVR